ncbi:cleft lip and palate associated transmembrane protein 1 [Aaosphaeria arxii CBS 175.79]|uniref:Cleft lip and palate associated transmembrane protein 1 n=1 Tax=Aaosphaeria arxii CBS 175.79 TaxID=1450172 RepID=A0A6A5XTS5_9PLEO|nr:cleft lip and palate associated transmembrane protein 1 [Aaosphaeria arxii CBS 175.79]KAF2016718.1 cleft lip and palate associated transmembrane protein 1 [Aaosphaeria arxii CBS 175.79]
MPEAQQQEEGGKSIFRTLAQSVGMFFLIQYGMKAIMPTPKAADPAKGGASVPSSGGVKVTIPPYAERPHQLDPGAQWNHYPQSVAPMWSPGTELDIVLYISPSIAMPPLSSMPKDSLVINEKNFKFGSYNENRVIETEFKVPKAVQNNATLFGHFYVAQSGSKLDPTVSGYNPSKAYHFVRPLTRYIPKKKVVKTRNLLSDLPDRDVEVEEDKDAPKVISSYYHPNFTLSAIPDTGVVHFPSMHPGVRAFFQLESEGARDASGQHSWYYPVLFTNTFWQLKKHMIELNDTVTTLPLNVKLNNLANWKFNLYASVEENIRSQQAAAAAGQASPTGGDGSEMEMFKEILIDSNSYLLAITAVVSVFHMIFEMLAFKNDVAHWRKKKDNVGTSVRTILANVVMQSIIFLYLMDNNENTSWMILFGQGMGIAIEAWKITKTVNVRVRESAPGSFIPYTVVFEDKHVLSETEKKTEEYDQIAFKYLYWVAIPLLIAYAIYSLMYDSHKSWYSFIITTLVGSVYAYGFLMMVPSLYINYRLKSVAHMPGRAMTYKFLNTFIDDLFAFTIKMPTLHRLATLRDDVIFFVYLYQTWVYKVDYTRVNEFGQGGDDEEEEEKKANEPLTAPADADKSPKVPEKDEATAKATGAQKKGEGRKRK